MRKLTCPRCRQAWEVEAVRAGMKAVCPHCQATITIAAPPVKPPPEQAAVPAATAQAQAPVAVKPATSARPASVGAASVDPNPSAVPAVADHASAAASAAVSSAGPARSIVPPPAEEASSDQGPSLPPTMSKIPVAVGAIVALTAVGIAIFLWSPWSKDDGRPAEQIAAVSPSVEDISAPTPAANAPPVAPPSVDSSPSVSDLASNDQASSDSREPLSGAAPEIVPPAIEPPRSPPRITNPRPVPTAAPIVAAPEPTPAARATAATAPQVSPIPPRTVYDKAPLPAGSEGAEPVTAKTTVRAGQRLHAEFQGKWYAVTVVEALADGNVRVRWETWGRDVVGNVARSRLRIPGAEKAAATP